MTPGGGAGPAPPLAGPVPREYREEPSPSSLASPRLLARLPDAPRLRQVAGPPAAGVGVCSRLREALPELVKLAPAVQLKLPPAWQDSGTQVADVVQLCVVCPVRGGIGPESGVPRDAGINPWTPAQAGPACALLAGAWGWGPAGTPGAVAAGCPVRGDTRERLGVSLNEASRPRPFPTRCAPELARPVTCTPTNRTVQSCCKVVGRVPG